MQKIWPIYCGTVLYCLMSATLQQSAGYWPCFKTVTAPTVVQALIAFKLQVPTIQIMVSKSCKFFVMAKNFFLKPFFQQDDHGIPQEISDLWSQCRWFTVLSEDCGTAGENAARLPAGNLRLSARDVGGSYGQMRGGETSSSGFPANFFLYFLIWSELIYTDIILDNKVRPG